MAERRKSGFPGNPQQYAGKVGVGTGPVPLQRWHRERSQHEAEALGESIPGTDLRPASHNGPNPKRAERRH
jgi:hypothetical protein